MKAAISSIETLVVIPYTTATPTLRKNQNEITFEAFLDTGHENHPFVQLPFQHPLLIMFSSGTTGKPKCIIHTAGGTLLEHVKELVLHSDLSSEGTFFIRLPAGG